MRNMLNLDGGALFNASALPPSRPEQPANKKKTARAQREQDADAQIHKTPAQVEGALRATVARSEHDDAAANLAEPHARADGAAAWDSFVPSASDFLVGCADPKAMEDTSTGLKVYAGKYERTTDGFGQCGSFGKGGRIAGTQHSVATSSTSQRVRWSNGASTVGGAGAAACTGLWCPITPAIPILAGASR